MSKKKRNLPTLHTFEFCDRIETENGKKSLIGLFEVINIVGLPAIHPEFTVVLGFSKGKGKFKGNFSILGPSDDKILEYPIFVELKNYDVFGYYVLTIKDMPIKELGKHRLIVMLEGKKMGERVFSANMLEVPELSEEEVEELLKQPDSLKKARAVVKCPKCQKEYIFQLNLDPKEPLDKGALPFPPNNKFTCPDDKIEIDLTAVKLSLKRVLGKPLLKKGGGNK